MKGLLNITMNPAMAFPNVLIAAKPRIVPPTTDKNPVTTVTLTLNNTSIVENTIRAVIILIIKLMCARDAPRVSASPFVSLSAQ